MTDARFPERWLNDRRLIRLSDGAFRLHMLTLAWSVSNRTDGVIEAADLPFILGADPHRAPELVKAGLWVEQGPAAWISVDYAATQTSRHDLEVLESVRRRDREKKARQRAQHRAEDDVSPGTSPGTSSPGTTQDRPGQARTGHDRQAMSSEEDPWSSPVPARGEYTGGPVDYFSGQQIGAGHA